MKEKIKSIVPESIWRKLTYLYLLLSHSEERYTYRLKMKLFYTEYPRLKKYHNEIEYMKRNDKLFMFPYSFIEKYQKGDIDVLFDQETELPYVYHKGKRLYYPADMDKDSIRNMYSSILVEQDEESPHRYFSEKYDFEENAVFMDIGSAEGNMALEIAEKAKVIFLFEMQDRWMSALRATFEPYKEKTHIIHKMAGDTISDVETTIDEVLKEHFSEGNIYIKIDAEGSEKKIIRGAENTLKTRNVKCACCTYHKQEDAEEIKEIFEKKNFVYEFSKGYTLFKAQKRLKYPYFSKGLIRVKNYNG